MKLREEVELTDAELKQAILEFVNKRIFSTDTRKWQYTKLSNIKLINGTVEEQLCITDIKFDVLKDN